VQAGLAEVFTGASTRHAGPFEGANPLARGGGGGGLGAAKSTRSVMSALGVAAVDSGVGGSGGGGAAPARDVTWEVAGFSSSAPAARSEFSNPMSRRDLR
jgi:hypothetical protein